MENGAAAEGGVVAAPLFMGDDVLRDAGDQYSQAPGST